EILEKLGEGGAGIVYKARQNSLRRIVALKMLPHAGQEERNRFQSEAEILARLQHDNIVQVYEVGEAQGIPFYSMEFIEGGSLEEYFQGKPRGDDEAARVVETLARVIAVAHQADIIHRDLKPANILLDPIRKEDHGEVVRTLSSSAEFGFALKIADFGLAKMMDVPTKTMTGTILGTPSYMAPEQARGNPRAVGRAADIYALGTILYEALSGEPPFKGKDYLDILTRVVSEPPKPLPRAHPDLEAVCLK